MFGCCCCLLHCVICDGKKFTLILLSFSFNSMRATYVERSKSKSEKGDGASDVAKGVSALTLEAKPAPRKPMDEVSKSKLFRLKLVKPLYSHMMYHIWYVRVHHQSLYYNMAHKITYYMY